MDKDRLSQAVFALSELMSRLRGPEGCPWDAIQTYSTIKMYLLEEAYEVLDAVEKGSPQDLCQELGDLLFQIVFLARLAEEKGEFDLVEVIERITEKMVNRHPHVFGSSQVRSPEEVADNWEKIKKKEKDVPKASSYLLRSVPVSLPGLLRAQRLLERASRADFVRPDKKGTWTHLEEEFEPLREAIRHQDKERIGEELGNFFFRLVSLARHWGLNAENLVRHANQQFLECFEEIEEELKASGIDPDRATPDEKKRAWEKVSARHCDKQDFDNGSGP